MRCSFVYFKISLVTFNGIIYKLRYNNDNKCYEYNIIVQVVDNCLYDLITGKKIIMKSDRIENHYLNHEYLLCSVFDFNMDSSIWYRSNGIGNFIAKSLSLGEVIYYLKKLSDEDITRYKLAMQSLEEEAKKYVMKYSKKL